MMLMRMKDVKDLDFKTLWFNNKNNDDDIKDLNLKVFWSEKVLIYIRRLRISRAKELIEFKSNEKKSNSNLMRKKDD